MGTTIQAPRGTKDIYGREAVAWQRLEEIMRKLCADFGISEMRTPIFEHTELFVRGVGDTTDVVQKEMYTFDDRGGRSLTLKPECTAGAIRAFVEHKLYADAAPYRMYCLSPVFRYERPQAGRMRQFHQFNVEFTGSYDPACDAELISVGYELFRRLGIPGVVLNINSLGCKDCHKRYHDVLHEFLSKNSEALCKTCQGRMERNPLRVLDCKDEACRDILRDAPVPLDILDDECREHFEEVKRSLDAMGIAYEINSHIVRGLDYYTRTVFEFISDDIGAQSTICGGGRYDKMIGEFGGPPTGSIGFGLGMERILLAMENTGRGFDTDVRPTIYIAAIGASGQLKARELCFVLRQKRINAESDIMGRALKSQMK
ncbi:MAG: histidine--tRNA ligase, partial [Defluviitaleaceae bacterium]|nr:histidine--tRNA ligase [Defluviitaleaceae bacterium]